MSRDSKDNKDAAKSKKILDECLKQPYNKTCCECGGKQPRWASTNLGCFMCIRCSGIHRNLGVHISKIKSVSLDTWPVEQAEFMATQGNEKSNAVWEFALPSNRKPVEEDATHIVEQFIKDKYEKKLFCKQEKPAKKGKAKAKAVAKTKATATTAAKKKKPADDDDEDDDDDSEDSDESDEEDDSEEERKAAAKKKKAAAAKKKAAAAAAAAKAKAAKEAEDDEEEEDDDEEVEQKAKAKAKAKKEKAGKKAAVKDSVDVSSRLAAVNLAAPATNGTSSHAGNDFGSSAFEVDFGDNGSSSSSFDAPNGVTETSSAGDDFFTSMSGDGQFNAPATKKVPSAAATKSIMDKFSASAALGGPNMMVAQGHQGFGMMPANAHMYAPQGAYPSQQPGLMPNNQNNNFYMQQQQLQHHQFQQQQQQHYNPQPQQFGGGFAGSSGFAPQAQAAAYGNPYAAQMQAQQQQMYNPNAYAQTQNPYGGGYGAQSDPLAMASAPVAAPVQAAPAKADPFAAFGSVAKQPSPAQTTSSSNNFFF